MYTFFDVYNTVIAISTICNQFIIIKIFHENAFNARQIKLPILNNLNIDYKIFYKINVTILL